MIVGFIGVLNIFKITAVGGIFSNILASILNLFVPFNVLVNIVYFFTIIFNLSAIIILFIAYKIRNKIKYLEENIINEKEIEKLREQISKA